MYILLECQQCGKKINVFPCRKNSAKFCSHSCAITKRNTGNKLSEETKNKIRLAHIGKKCSEELKTRLSTLRKNIPKSENWKNQMSEFRKNNQFGNKNPNWRGGVHPFIDLLRNSELYNKWRIAVYKKDGYKCQICFGKNKHRIEAHHKIPLRILIKEFFEYFNQFSPIEDKEVLLRLSFNYNKFWDIENGVTYCIACHRKQDSLIQL